MKVELHMRCRRHTPSLFVLLRGRRYSCCFEEEGQSPATTGTAVPGHHRFADRLEVQAGDIHPFTLLLSNATVALASVRLTLGWKADVLCVLSKSTRDDLGGDDFGVCGHQLDAIHGPKVLPISASVKDPLDSPGDSAVAVGHQPEIEHRFRPDVKRKSAATGGGEITVVEVSRSSTLGDVEELSLSSMISSMVLLTMRSPGR